jgi:alkylation response protein AidB-like acyl-CoA dehydrogenase
VRIQAAASEEDNSVIRDWANRPVVQRKVAECELSYYSARSAVYTALADEWELLSSSKQLSKRTRALLALVRFNAFRTARNCVSQLSDLISVNSISNCNMPIEEILCDLSMSMKHAVAKEEIILETGGMLLGKEGVSPFV